MAQSTTFINIKKFGAKADKTSDDTYALNQAIESLAPEGGEILVPFDSLIVIENIRFPDHPEYTGNGKWVNGSRGNYIVYFQGSTLGDKLFAPRYIIHGYQSDGYVSGLAIAGSHHPNVSLEPSLVPLNPALTSGIQSKGGSLNSFIHAGKKRLNGVTTLIPYYQVGTDLYNDGGNEYQVRYHKGFDIAALSIFGDITNPLDIGACTSATVSTMTDTSKAWTIDQFAGKDVSVTGVNAYGRVITQVRKIVSNTVDTLTLNTTIGEGDLNPIPTNTFTYVIGDLAPRTEVEKLKINKELIGNVKVNQVSGEKVSFINETGILSVELKSMDDT